LSLKQAKYHSFVFVSQNIVYSQKLVVFCDDTYKRFSELTSSFHIEWVLFYGCNLETRPVYTPSDVFETFPFPNLTPAQEQTLNHIGKQYYQHRQAIMTATQLGLTKTYNRFHDPQETAPDIEKLRQLHIEMDQAVCAAYGWNDLLEGNRELAIGNSSTPHSPQS